jgi:cation transport regulator ChaC
VGGLTVAEWVFGYASLVPDHGGDGAVPAELRGYRRVWGVATDNTRLIPGYKMYLSREDGSRPELYVTFLDLEHDPASTVRGLARRVDADQLAALDLRERNYERVDVSENVTGVQGTVWVYLGSEEGRARLAAGLREGSAAISRDYLEKVRTGLRAHGIADEMPDGPPVRDLERVDIPA